MEKRSSNHFIVAVGASAGGLEAIHEFFDHTNDIKQFSYVVIQHLSPDHKSLLVELVSKHTKMKVVEAGQDMSTKPGHVYIIPNNKLISIKNGKLKLNDKENVKAPNTAIDTFLFSLAADQQQNAIAVILSGTGTDGTKGIEAIKSNGGLVVVQEPSSSKFDGMPNSAIASGNADLVLEPKEMGAGIERLVKHESAHLDSESTISDQSLEKIFNLIYKNNGHDFNYYKSPTIIRRIEKRMIEQSFSDLDQYIDHLEHNPTEVKALGEEFLIGVTRFFRDREAFAILAEKVIPSIVDVKQEKESIKVWICACSTGEEAYSIAILIDQYLRKVKRRLDVKIFATDIDENSLKIAQRNFYPASIEKDIDPGILTSYFLKIGKEYSVIPRIRKQIVFAMHNVIKNPPFIKNDLVSCRNMLIYVNNILQQKLLATFHFSLNEQGYLFLGSSESATFIKEGIAEVDSKWKIYRKTSSQKFLTQEIYKNTRTSRGPSDTEGTPDLPEPIKHSSVSIENEMQNLLVNELGYVAIYIDRHFNVKDTLGDFKKYLSLPEKKLNLNLLKMVPAQLSGALNSAIRKADKSQETIVINKEITVKDNQLASFRLVVKPLADRNCFMVLMNEVAQKEFKAASENVVFVSDEQQNDYIQEIEAELEETKADLQTAMEEMETTNEELQSSNEELLSANEELQSSNEELQSLNEELHTLNTEHQAKIKELTELNDDLDNYFRSTDIGQIFIDKDLKIRKFNPAAIRLVNLILSDIGRPIDHISTNIEYGNLLSDIKEVMSGNPVIEKEVVLRNNSKSMMRIIPYVRQDKKSDGVVVSFVDITALSELNNIIKSTFNASKSAIIAYNSVRNPDQIIVDFRYMTGNEAAQTFLNTDLADLKGQSIKEQSVALSQKELFDKLIEVVTYGRTYQTELEITSDKWYDLVAVKMLDGFVLTLTDISEKKLSAKKLKRNFNELIVAREALRTLNSDLEEKVRERTLELSESEERFSLVSEATNDTVWDWNLASNKTWRSSNFVKMFGYSKNEETANLDFWIGKIHPEEREAVRNSIYFAINNNSSQWSAEYRFQKEDGTYSYVLDRAQILRNEHNIPYRMLGSVVDVSRIVELNNIVQKQQEEFQRIFMNAPAQIIIKRGESLQYEFVNKQAADFLQLHEAVGKLSEDVHIEWEGADTIEQELQVMKTGQQIERKAYEVKREDKTSNNVISRWFDYIIEPVYDNNGNIDGIARFAFDVTDMIKAQKATNLLLEKKDEFMSIASHELKTPLTSVKGFMQLLEYRISKADEHRPLYELVVKSNNQINKLTTLINDLLDVTKIQGGKLMLNLHAFQSPELLTDSLEGFIEANAQHEVVITSNEDVPLYADKNRLEQVINNFVSNAIKYSPAADRILIRSEVVNDEYFFSVQDFGIGIPQDKYDFVFDRFFRVNDSTEYYAGLGLGLYISAQIIQKHGGRFGCHSELGKGSTFWFTIPIES